MGRGEGAQKPRKWEENIATRWCHMCRDFTEQDHMGCSECFDGAPLAATSGSEDPRAEEEG